MVQSTQLRHLSHGDIIMDISQKKKLLLLLTYDSAVYEFGHAN